MGKAQQSFVETAGGNYDPADKGIYFLATNVTFAGDIIDLDTPVLIPMNELEGEENVLRTEQWMKAGKLVFVDSGIYALTNVHARKHGIHMNEALSLAPDKVDGFDALYEQYVEICKRFEAHCWGYLELDQGGRENKRKTRALLESEGLRPMPVYHPLNDGWEYFDELAQGYDRIGVGNVVMADRRTRKRILATMAERMEDYPDLWIHLLGLTPNEWLYALPVSSADSSSWLSGLRWAGYIPKAMGKALGHLPKNYSYIMGRGQSSEDGLYLKATRMGAMGARSVQLNWQMHLRKMEALQMMERSDG